MELFYVQKWASCFDRLGAIQTTDNPLKYETYLSFRGKKNCRKRRKGQLLAFNSFFHTGSLKQLIV